MIGGGGEKVLLRIVAQHADRWNFGGSVADFRRKVAILDDHCRAVGRDPAAIERTWFGTILIEPNDERLQHRLAKRAARGGAELLQGIVGTPAGVIARINEYVALGVTHFIAMFGRVENLGATELFAREVIPAFRQ
jgi:alkanesulfonate monooxygenase SsuD/methylene tetrahydromethanopterin reductase-like flavin-dependent oxidoreductase (luciferase family)